MRKALVAAAGLGLVAVLAASAGAAKPPPGSGIVAEQKRAQEVLAQVNVLDVRFGKVVDSWDGARIDLAATRRALAANRLALRRAQRRARAASARLAQRLVAIYENGEPTLLEVIAGASSLGDLLDRLHAADTIASYDRDLAEQATRSTARLTQVRGQLRSAERKRRALLGTLDAERRRIGAMLVERRRLLSSIRSQVVAMRKREAMRQKALAAAARARLAHEQAEARAVTARAAAARTAAARAAAARAAAARAVAAQAAAAAARAARAHTMPAAPATPPPTTAAEPTPTRPGATTATTTGTTTPEVTAPAPTTTAPTTTAAAVPTTIAPTTPATTTTATATLAPSTPAPTTPAAAVPPATSTVTSPSSSLGPGHPEAASIALRYLGVPYRWGGASPSTGFDCSGLVMYVYAELGIQLPHQAAAQYGYGVPVPRDQLEPGDLVFFDELSHVGIYIGNGEMVHAPQTGDVVSITPLSQYGSARYVGARRLP